MDTSIKKAVFSIFVLCLLQISCSVYIGKYKFVENKNFILLRHAVEQQRNENLYNRAKLMTKLTAKTSSLPFIKNDSQIPKMIYFNLFKTRRRIQEKLFKLIFTKLFNINKSKYSNQTKFHSTSKYNANKLLKNHINSENFYSNFIKLISLRTWQSSWYWKKNRQNLLSSVNFSKLRLLPLLKYVCSHGNLTLPLQNKNLGLKWFLFEACQRLEKLESHLFKRQIAKLFPAFHDDRQSSGSFIRFRFVGESSIFFTNSGRHKNIEKFPVNPRRRKRFVFESSLKHGIFNGKEIPSLYLDESGKILRVFQDGTIRGVDWKKADNYCAINIILDLSRKINGSGIVKLYAMMSQLYIAMAKDFTLYTTCDANDSNTDFVHHYSPLMQDWFESVEHHSYLAFSFNGKPFNRNITNQNDGRTKFLIIDLRKYNKSVSETFSENPLLSVKRPKRFNAKGCQLSPAVPSINTTLIQQHFPVTSEKPKIRKETENRKKIISIK